MAENQVEVLLSVMGAGKWNILHLFTAAYASAMPVPHAMGGPFVVPRLQHNCLMTSGASDDVRANSSEIDHCNYIDRTSNGSTTEVPCTKWDFDNSTFTNTMTSEFGLVCQTDYVRALYMSLYMIGVLVASPTLGYLADRFGRKKIFTIGCLSFIILSFISGWLPNVPAILACRFLIGLTHVPVVKISFILGMESSTKKTRSMAGVSMYVLWTVYVIIFSGFGYLVRDWRWLMTLASVPSLLLLPLLWYTDESPHWLAVQGKYSEALEVIKKAARWNKASLPSDDEVIALLKSNAVAPKAKEEQPEKSSLLSVIERSVKDLFILFRTPRLRGISAVMHLNHFVVDMVYYGLSYSGGSFKFDIYFYMVLLGITEFPGRILMVPIVNRFGRKIPLIANLMTTGIILICIAFIPSDMQWLIVTFALMGRMTVCASSCINYLIGSELFPTEVRTRGINNSFMMSRVGSSIAPFITEYLGHAYQWAPSVVFGVAAIVAGLASMTLWDTIGLTLPDTIHFLENNDPRAAAREVQLARRNQRKQKRTEGNLEEQMQLHSGAQKQKS